MRSGEAVIENPALSATKGLTELCIVIDDFDSNAKTPNPKEIKITAPEPAAKICIQPTKSEGEIKKILEEAEHRKNEFWKLIEEYSEVVENIKRIEQLEHNSVRKVQSPIST